MYVNQTADELNTERCTTEGIFKFLTSPWLKVNFILTITIILLTFIYSYKAVKCLIYHNVFSTCTQILLFACLINGNIFQFNLLQIRIFNFIHITKYADDPCLIETHSSQCFYQQTINKYCSNLLAFLVFSLTCDRFAALLFPSFYAFNLKLIAFILIMFSLLATFCVHLFVFYRIPLAGFVPMCTYPPQLSLDNYDKANNANVWFSVFTALVTLIILYLSIKKERIIKLSSFNTTVRYNSYENLVTTRAICLIAITQLFFLIMNSFAFLFLRFFESGLGQEVYHTSAVFFIGMVYGQLSIPILIVFKTHKCMNIRKKRIGTMTKVFENVDTHINSLKTMWA